MHTLMNPTMRSLMLNKLGSTLTELLDDLQNDPEGMALYAECYPDVWDDLAEKGYQCLELEQNVQAARIFSFLLSYFPEEAAFHAAYADALCSMKKYLDAASHYLDTTEYAPAVPDAFYYLSEIYMMLKHPQYAVDPLETASVLADEEHYLNESIPKRLSYAQDAAMNV